MLEVRAAATYVPPWLHVQLRALHGYTKSVYDNKGKLLGNVPTVLPYVPNLQQ